MRHTLCIGIAIGVHRVGAAAMIRVQTTSDEASQKAKIFPESTATMGSS